MDATTIWTLLSIFVIAPLGALAIDRPLFGNWIWRIGPENTAREYGGSILGFKTLVNAGYGSPPTGRGMDWRTMDLMGRG